MKLNNNRPELVLITGVSGAVGPCVVGVLCSAGHQVRSFSLDALQGTFPSGVQSLIGDVTEPLAVQSAMHGVDAVVHLAALLHIVNPPPELRKKYERINVGGTATVVEAAGIQAHPGSARCFAEARGAGGAEAG